MRIPIYKAGAAPTSEAPGRSLGARMRAEPFVRQAQAKGQIVSAVASQVGEFAATRYKAAREAQINEKILAGEEALAEETRRLAKIGTGQLRDVFNEGGDEGEGLWARATSATRDKLLEDVKDREARRILTDRFNQMELTQRFRLRGTIDQKIEAANTAARAARLQQAAQAGANATDLGEFDLVMQNLGIDSVRLAQLRLGNPDALKAQEYSVLYNSILGSVRKFANESETPSKDLEALRVALRDGDPNKAGRGQLQFGLLNKLPIGVQAKILQSVGAGATFIDAPTEEEKKIQRMAVEYGKQAGQMVTDYTSRLQEGQTLPDGAIDQLASVASQAMTAMEPIARQELQEGIADLTYIQSLSEQVKGVTNVKGINDLIMTLEQGDTFGGEGIQPREQLGLEFLRGFKANMEKQLEADPIGYASTTGSVKVAPIDLSPQAVQSSVQSGMDNTGVQRRIQDAIKVRGHYELTGSMKLLTPAEVAAYAPSLNRGTAVERIQAISAVQQLFGDYAPAVLQQLSKDAPVTTHVAGLIRDGLAPEAEIIMKGVQEIEANGVPIEGTDMREAESQMSAILGGAYELLPGQLNASLKKNVKDTALAYYAEVLSRRVDKTFDEDLWTEAVQVSTGYNRRTGQGGIQEVRGKPTLLPPNRTPDEIENALSQVNRENFSAIAATQEIDEETFNDIKGDGDYSFQVLGRRNGKIVYGVVYGEYGESGYAIMTDQDGGDIMFTAEDLVNAARASESTRVKGLAARPGIRAAAEPAPQQAPSDQGFDIRSYDRSDPAQTNQATIEISKIIANNFDVGSVGVDEVRSYLREQRIPHSNKMIETAINVAKQTGGM